MNTSDRNIEEWSNDFGNDYIKRNPIKEDLLVSRVDMWNYLLKKMDKDNIFNFLEVGCNLGYNLRALKKIENFNLFAAEPNKIARDKIISDGILMRDNIIETSAQNLTFSTSSMDIALTYGVLIHIGDKNLIPSMRQIHRVSKRYIITIEYFSDKPTEIEYGDVLLKKRDYGSIWLDNFSNISLVEYGFFWKRITGLDNVHWWIFEKK